MQIGDLALATEVSRALGKTRDDQRNMLRSGAFPPEFGPQGEEKRWALPRGIAPMLGVAYRAADVGHKPGEIQSLIRKHRQELLKREIAYLVTGPVAGFSMAIRATAGAATDLANAMADILEKQPIFSVIDVAEINSKIDQAFDCPINKRHFRDPRPAGELITAVKVGAARKAPKKRKAA